MISSRGRVGGTEQDRDGWLVMPPGVKIVACETPTFKVIEPGTKVTIAGGLEAVVLMVRIDRGPSVDYEVGYWKGNEWCVVYLPDYQVGPVEKTLTIGFVQQPLDTPPAADNTV